MEDFLLVLESFSIQPVFLRWAYHRTEPYSMFAAKTKPKYPHAGAHIYRKAIYESEGLWITVEPKEAVHSFWRVSRNYTLYWFAGSFASRGFARHLPWASFQKPVISNLAYQPFSIRVFLHFPRTEGFPTEGGDNLSLRFGPNISTDSAFWHNSSY